MKKVLFLLALGFLSFGSADGAYEQLEDTAYYGNEATRAGSDEEARQLSGCGFDYDCPTPTVVDLSGAGEHPTVDSTILQTYDPVEPSLKPSYVPPLP